MDAIQHLEILPLDKPWHEEHADWEEGEQEEREDHLDVWPGVETKEAQTNKLPHLLKQNRKKSTTFLHTILQYNTIPDMQ